MGLSPSIIPLVDLAYLLPRLFSRQSVADNSREQKPLNDYTIIMPLYNKENVILKTLESWRAYKDHLLVVDDASQDAGASLVQRAGFNLFSCEKNGKKIGAIARALETVTTKYSVLVDADVCVDPTSEKTLDNIVSLLDQDSIEAGTCEIISDKNQHGVYPLLVFQWLDHKNGMLLGKHFFGTGTKKQVLCSGGFGVYRTDVLKEITAHQLRQQRTSFLGEDLERNLEIISRNGSIGFYHGFRVIADAPKNLSEFTTQRIRWKEGALRYFKKYAHLMSGSGKFLDKVANEMKFEQLFNTYGNPIKVASLPLLAYYGSEDPLMIAGFYGTFAAISAATFMKILPPKEFVKNMHYIALYPAFKLYELIATIHAYKTCLKKNE